MTSDAIVTENLTKVYGKLTAVDHVNVKVASGTVFGLLGPNGAGKTTMIKLLTGLTDMTEGEAWVAGFDVRRDPMHVKQRIGWVASEVILDDDFTAWENLWLQAKLQSLAEWKERAGDLLTYFGLNDRRKDRVKTFSTGMRKKLEIALALLHQPEVVFMDEPTIGLDANTRRMLWDLITGVNKEFGITVLLTSHYIEEADALCDQISIIDHGKSVASGTPTALTARVQSDFVELETSEAVDDAHLRSVRGALRPRAPPDVPESVGARDHVRATVHVACVLREQLQRRLSGPRPADLPHEQLHRVPASGRPGDLDVDRGHVRIHEHDPGQALRIHEAHPADADDEIHRVPFEGPRIDEPRAHPDPGHDPGGRAVRRQLSGRSDHVGRVDPRDLLPRPRDVVLLPGRDGL